ncbi:oxidoreductase [Lithospermum erythrorhizon]|uniref:Oxidoreductase n=1 Tax=Lithospermum erythrorhizon TaxID=34254 RepID=A0AAV3S426_LITER
MVAFAIAAYGQLDIMFSNAGIFNVCQTVLDLDLAFMDRTFSINARGMAACVKHEARAMVEGKIKGSIVCTASMTGSMGGQFSTDYFMSKHAVIGLMRCAWRIDGGFTV